MPPRATVQQAVELLKIHQLRRENAALHEQIQGLRDTVVDLKGTHEELRDSFGRFKIEIQSDKSSTANHGKQLKPLASDVQDLLRRFKRVDTILNDGQKENNSRWTELSMWQNLVESNLVRIERTIKDHQEQSELSRKDMVEQMMAIKETLENKAELADVLAIDARLKRVCQNGVVSVDCPRSLSRIEDSIDQYKHSGNLWIHGNGSCTAKRGKQVQDELPSTQVACPCDEETELDADDLDGKSLGTANHASTLPDDIDLDEDTTGTGQSEQRTKSSSIIASTVGTMPFAIRGVDPVLIDQARASLRQQEMEATADYIGRGRRLLKTILCDVEQILLYRLVEGLSDSRQQNLCERWLDAFTWSWKYLEEITQLAGLTQPPPVKETIMHIDRPLDKETQMKRSDIPERDGFEQGPLRNGRHSCNQVHGVQLRRSQRIANEIDKQKSPVPNSDDEDVAYCDLASQPVVGSNYSQQVLQKEFDSFHDDNCDTAIIARGKKIYKDRVRATDKAHKIGGETCRDDIGAFSLQGFPEPHKRSTSSFKTPERDARGRFQKHDAGGLQNSTPAANTLNSTVRRTTVVDNNDALPFAPTSRPVTKNKSSKVKPKGKSGVTSKNEAETENMGAGADEMRNEEGRTNDDQVLPTNPCKEVRKRKVHELESAAAKDHKRTRPQNYGRQNKRCRRLFPSLTVPISST